MSTALYWVAVCLAPRGARREEGGMTVCRLGGQPQPYGGFQDGDGRFAGNTHGDRPAGCGGGSSEGAGGFGDTMSQCSLWDMRTEESKGS